MTLQRKKLPIGIQTFAKIREDDYYYVDKTALALKLIDTGTHYFLSRPRRFGKSLFLDTLAELFEGNESLFRGLQCHGRWDWTQRYPVIRLSFGAGRLSKAAGLQEHIQASLDDNAVRLNVSLEPPTQSPHLRFRQLIQQAHAQHGQRVVVLVDEYDKPILDNLTEPAIARQMRDGLRDLYSVIKDNDAHIRFAFLTGVSKFSKVSIFSGLNNLNDITIDASYSAICGYTDEDVDTVFAPELMDLDREEIRAWYNGYNWTGTSVYNPFDLLLLFDKREFRPYWFETGTPTFLIDVLAQRQPPSRPHLQQMVAICPRLLSSFDVDHIATEALLWQTGYLTIASQFQIGARTEVHADATPTCEVQASLNDSLLQPPVAVTCPPSGGISGQAVPPAAGAQPGGAAGAC
ncbi:hypothetical protein MASR1M59_29260 [Melaminivora sp.]